MDLVHKYRANTVALALYVFQRDEKLCFLCVWRAIFACSCCFVPRPFLSFSLGVLISQREFYGLVAQCICCVNIKWPFSKLQKGSSRTCSVNLARSIVVKSSQNLEY